MALENSSSLFGAIKRQLYAPKASGDRTGVTDRNNLNKAYAEAASNKLALVIPRSDYIVDVAVNVPSYTTTFIESNTTIKLRDKIVVSGTYTSGSATITVDNPTNIIVGMYVSDSTANLQANNAFGAMPYGTKVSAVNGNQITLTIAPTANGTGNTIYFHPRSNILNLINVTNSSVVCLGGWAQLDGNWTNQYPYNVNADDAFGNGLRIVNPTNIFIDGISSDNSFFHGGIIVGKVSGLRIGRYRGIGNGYRSIHMHGESTDGGTTWPEVRDSQFDSLETENGGHRSFYTRGGDEASGGIFLVYSNVLNTKIGHVRARNEMGYGFHVSGGTTASGSLPKFPSKRVQIDSMSFEDCGTGFEIDNAVEGIDVSKFNSFGRKLQIDNATTIDAASTLKYYVTSTGVVGNVKSRKIKVPAGQVALSGVRAGHRVFMSGGNTGAPTYGLVVWEVDAVADTITVFNQEIPANDPYTTVYSTAGMPLFVRGFRDCGINSNSPVSTVIKNIKFGSINMENSGRYGIQTAYSSSQFRMTDVSFGNVSISGCTSNALYLGSINGFQFNSFYEKNNGSGFETGSAAGGANNYFVNCSNFTIDNFRSEHDAAFLNNQCKLRLDVDCRSAKINATGVKKPGAGATFEVLVAANAVANASGIQGPIVFNNPVANDGTALTVAGGHIARVDAVSCIITRPVDAP